uniref:ATP-binding cassette sub-family A member 2 (inferred by orthology to a human protein) n=1 Tax=Strongyloides venezuelensis TaxID=75913 RepID=A0A0K0FHH6_STRVS
MCIATYFLTIYPLFIERIKGFKQQQYYAGVSPLLYWISNFIADTIIGIIVFSSLIVLFGFLNEDSNFLPFFQAACIYFFMNLPIFYCLTFFGKYFSNTCGFLGIIFMTLQGIMCIVFEKNNIGENEYNAKNKNYVWKIIKTYMNPFTILYKIQIARYYGNESDKKNANYLMNLPIGLPITVVYILILFSFLILIECGVLISIRNWIETVRSIINESNNAKSRRRRQMFDSKTTTEEDISNNLDESCFISTIRPNDEPTIIMEHAKPYLRDVNLQRGLNFDVFPGECYCWYIKDDKERESIFNFMTGNIKKKEGSITIYDRDVNTRMRMGYSPSKNAILPFFTPFEHYKFFALLSGFRKSKLQSINMLNLTGLIQCRHKQLQYCDSNQKRRLVVGISALTQSGALFLDTPTEYLYKQGRNEIWELISILLVEKEESIVITTNNLEECNELSSRFGYINNGYVDYNGTYTGLKEINCDGYNFKITVSNPSLEVLICLDQIMVSELDAIPGDLTKITSLMEWDVPKQQKVVKFYHGLMCIQLPINCNDNVNDVNNLTKSDTTAITINNTASTIDTEVDDDSDEDEDDNKTEDEGDSVSGYCSIRSSLTVPHIIDYVITNNSLEQIIFKIQNSNL